MTRLLNDPNDFVADMSRGFALASSRWVRAVTGGVVRSTAASEPTVSLVIGGGSGHFPAFSGLVGPGLAHGTAMGNVFASPSTKQILSVARSCDQGRGVLFSYGNYAGDVLNFDQAQERLRAEGIETRTVVVTDDIFSASRDEIDKRRGIAGDLVVFKIAGAAAEAGLELDEVERLARSANDRTRSIGVAFSGCTLPGADEPLFTVPDGQMAIGLGIHGEPGIDEVPLPSAIQLAELLVSRLLIEAPDSSRRVVPILNGLGTVKYEELYLLYGLIDPLLRDAGYELVDPEVGEFCTSFDMAGLSLTLLWLDDELEPLWATPCSSAAFTRGELGGAHLPATNGGPVSAEEQERAAASVSAAPPTRGVDKQVDTPASAASRQLGAEISSLITQIAVVLDDAAGELGRLDSVAGDGDHGIGMQRGSKAAARAAADATTAGHGAEVVLAEAGEAWADVGGGTSGAIWGRIIGTLAAGFAGDSRPEPAAISAAINAAVDEVRTFGGVEVGDKTLLDALVPFATEFSRTVSSTGDGSTGEDSTGDDSTPLVLARAATGAAHAAAQAAQSTADLVAMRGRARSHGDRSVGTPDPGAVSLAMIASAIAEHFTPDTTSPNSRHTKRKAARS
ncbi:dihydroxyacetone kinase family protein [Brevibacterium sp. ZH18]|uniref:dihydroxyacetone kinase family protein n=1 Tax=Brevibacterium sp. ZH18 TaxID=2927784 RepID=UPI001F620E9C|nr:dihydroxyacetone kinase family protein [Brevibacterium sp. ZH18]